MRIGVAVRFWKAKIEHPCLSTDGMIAQFEDRDIRFATATSQVFNRYFQSQAVQNDHIGFGQVADITGRWMERVRVGTLRDKAVQMDDVPSYLVGEVGDWRHRRYHP